MARIQKKEKYSLFVRLLCLFQRWKYKRVLPPTYVWGYVPKLYLPFLKLGAAFRKKSSLDRKLKGYLMLYISMFNECSFCVDLNASELLDMQEDTNKIQVLKQFETSKLFSEDEKCALTFCKKLLLKEAITEDFFEGLKTRFSNEQIVEMTALIGFQFFSSLFNSALDVQSFDFCNLDLK
ncbi:MAG: hypothetical protein K940chlam8_00805 [Chlamydiae bacterium]|nr:hypothetical protein [Chlamydiota bacterium]